MSPTAPDWISALLGEPPFEALAAKLPASAVWSFLLEVMSRRASQRRAPELVQQWERDRFTQPSYLDQRLHVAVDGHLLAAAPSFEALELSPVAPLGSASVVGLTSQHKILSALRGTELVSDPTNVLALECARRLKAYPEKAVRLTTCHRCVRAQPAPKFRGAAQTFRIFVLATAGLEREDHGFTVEALLEQIRTQLGALDRLEQHGYAFGERSVKLLATTPRAKLGDRIAAALPGITVVRETLEHPYYHELRFQIAARTSDGNLLPFIDGGAFDWLGKLTSNRRLRFIASGMGSQLLPLLFRSA